MTVMLCTDSTDDYIDYITSISTGTSWLAGGLFNSVFQASSLRSYKLLDYNQFGFRLLLSVPRPQP